jgi:hypothetical protein
MTTVDVELCFALGVFLPTHGRRTNMGRGLLLWLIGIPLPIILIIWLLGGLHG